MPLPRHSGFIFNLQRYSIHDGPGIRSTVFLKGCPLDCWWCHNPEGRAPGPELVLWPGKCLGCGECVEACPAGAATPARWARPSDLAADVPSTGGHRADGSADAPPAGPCTLCGTCVAACPAEAREMVGRRWTVGEVIEAVARDRVFYEESGGGVTFSGGEPLMQPEFLLELLRRCRAEGIHTAVDTTGYAAWETLLEVSRYADLFLYDIKHMDDARHRQYTGVSNRPILDNLTKLVAVHPDVRLRMPVIPGVNDDAANFACLGAFLADLSAASLGRRPMSISLLPYHRTGVDKFARLGRVYRLPDTRPPSDERMAQLAETLRGYGLEVRLGG